MFKANIIENITYYKSRRIDFLLMLVASLLSGMAVNLLDLPVGVTVFLIFGIICLKVVRYQNTDKFKNPSNRRTIEIDEMEIKILDGNGEIKSSYQVRDLQEIKTNYDFNIPFETLSSVKGEVSGNFSKNFLSFSFMQGERRYEFELPSNYMIVQLKKILEKWEKKGCRISRA